MFEVINQNNAVNIYEEYFEEIDCVNTKEESSARNIDRFRDPVKDFKVCTYINHIYLDILLNLLVYDGLLIYYFKC